MKKLAALGLIAAILGLASPAFAQYSPSFISCNPTNLTPGGNVSCSAGYFKPGTSVTWTLNSTPINLGSTVADAQGVASIDFTVPAGLELGAHSVVASGIGIDGVANSTISVTAGLSLGSVAATTSSTAGGLPVTGSNTGTMTAIAMALVAGGGLLVLSTRSRRPARERVGSDR